MTPGVPLPTDAWRERADTDPYFTDEIIGATEVLLLRFRAALGDGLPPERIMAAVEELIVGLNGLGGLDGELGNFIETTEREELCAFIDQEATIAGLTIDPRTDITEEWREW